MSWAGLRGAVPIVLATYPIVAGVPGSEQILDIVFVAVVVFTLLQGPTLPAAARALRLVPPDTTRELLVEAAPLDRLNAELLDTHRPAEITTARGRRVRTPSAPTRRHQPDHPQGRGPRPRPPRPPCSPATNSSSSPPPRSANAPNAASARSAAADASHAGSANTAPPPCDHGESRVPGCGFEARPAPRTAATGGRLVDRRLLPRPRVAARHVQHQGLRRLRRARRPRTGPLRTICVKRLVERTAAPHEDIRHTEREQKPGRTHTRFGDRRRVARRLGADDVDRADDVVLHLRASSLLTPACSAARMRSWSACRPSRAALKGCGTSRGVDEEVGQVPHPPAGLGHDPGVGHVVDGVMEAPVERAVAVGAVAGTGLDRRSTDLVEIRSSSASCCGVRRSAAMPAMVPSKPPNMTKKSLDLGRAERWRRVSRPGEQPRSARRRPAGEGLP